MNRGNELALGTDCKAGQATEKRRPLEHYSLKCGDWAVSIGDTRSSYLYNLHDNFPCVTWQGTVEMAGLNQCATYVISEGNDNDVERNVRFVGIMKVVWICGIVPRHGNMVSELLEVDDSRQGEHKRTIDELMRWPLWGLKSEIKLMYFYFVTFKGRSRREQIFIDSSRKRQAVLKEIAEILPVPLLGRYSVPCEKITNQSL
jgi:hypothetical protein